MHKVKIGLEVYRLMEHHAPFFYGKYLFTSLYAIYRRIVQSQNITSYKRRSVCEFAVRKTFLCCKLLDSNDARYHLKLASYYFW